MATNKHILPAGWRWTKLGDICSLKVATRDPRNEPDDEFTYIDITSIESFDKFISEPKKLLGKNAPSRARQIVHAGDVIVSTTRPNLNAIAKIPSELDGQICSTGFCVLRPNQEELDSDFLFHFVRTQEFVKNLSDLVKGALYPAVTDKDVRTQTLPLPPLTEQWRIAARLNEQMAAVAQARRSTEGQLQAARELRSAYLHSAFSGLWRESAQKRIGELCEIKGGKRLPAGTKFALSQTSHPYIRVVDFYEGSVKTEHLQYVDEQTYEQISRYIIRRDDVYLSIAGTIGVAGAVPDELDNANLTENACRLVIRDKNILERDFLSVYLRSPDGQKQISLRTNQVGQPKLALERIATIEIPVPPLPMQRKVVMELNNKLAESSSLRDTLESQFAEIDQLPAALLREAFSGGLA